MNTSPCRRLYPGQPVQGSHPGAPCPEEFEIDDEKTQTRFEQVSAQILAHPALFRRLLDRVQARRRRRRLFKRLKADGRAALRAQKARLRKELAAWGITLKGFEFRGQRAALKRRLGAAAAIEGLIDAHGRVGTTT